MPAQNLTAGGVLGAIFGTLGLSALAGLLVTVMVAPALAVTGVTASSTIGIFDSLPDYLELDEGSQQNQIVAINDSGDVVNIATVFYQNREQISLDEMSPYLAQAAIAGEDRRFYDHGGVDMPSVIRAALGQATGADAGGASTLTMQTVRNIIVTQIVNNPDYDIDTQTELIAEALDPSIDRKLREMKLAIGLEQRYSKEEILTGYLNIAGFGGNTYGVQAASEQYFSKNASDLTIAEAASLIAIVQYPNARSLATPDNYAANQERRDVILTAMHEEGYITLEERDEAIATPVDEEFVNYSAPKNGCLAAKTQYRFACDYATRQVETLASLGTTEEERLENWKRGGYTLVLSINPSLAKTANSTVKKYADPDEDRFELGAAVSSIEVGTGRIIVMAQNKTFDNTLDGGGDSTTAVNFNTDLAGGGGSGFQPGSTYKPYVLLAFLDAGHGVNEAFDAGITEFNYAEFFDSNIGGTYGGTTFKVRNDAGEKGSYTVVRGTAGSVNSVFMQMAADVDQARIAELAASIGVHRGDGAADGSDLATKPSCAIGGCENNIAPLTQAAAYAAIANEGVYCEPIIIDTVIDPAGTELQGQPQVCGQSLVSPEVANTAAYAMASVMTGTAAASNPYDGTPYIGKTGTTDASVHTWMVGTSTEVATAVWVGNIVGTQALRSIYINGIQAAVLRHTIFKPIALEIDKRYPGSAFAAPDPALLTGNPVTVPEGLIGGTPEAAKSAIELAELRYKDAGEVDSDLPEGVVAKVSPGEGSSQPRGTEVKVYTSNGKSAVVPDVSTQGYDYSDAETVLIDAGFENVAEACVVATVDDPPASIGTVVAQDPAAGSVMNKNKTVTLTVRKVACP